jgi:hypothetical protein
MKPRYSGDKSKRFWKQINALNNHGQWKELYSIGVHLQNLESEALKMLKAARKKAKK